MLLHYSWQFILIIVFQTHLLATSTNWPPLDRSNLKIIGLFSEPNITRAEVPQFSALFKSALVLAQMLNITINGQTIGWQIEQTVGDVIDTVRSVCLAQSVVDVVGIIGPRLSREAHTVAALGKRLGVPVIAYSATDPDLASRSIYSTFYRTVPSDASAVLSLLHLFKHFNWTSCVIIYQTDTYGYSGMRLITEKFMKNKIKVEEMIRFDISRLEFDNNLKDYLMNSGTRIILLWSVASLTPIILKQALDQNVLGPHFVWILSSSPPLNEFFPEYSPYVLGMLSIEPMTGDIFKGAINEDVLGQAFDVWQKYEPSTFPGKDRVDQYALFAFDAVWLLIQALQELCNSTKNSRTPCIIFRNSSSCFDEHIENVQPLLDKISSIKLLGITGDIEFHSNDTDRKAGIYYIVKNVLRTSHGIGFVPVLAYSNNEGWQPYQIPTEIIWPGRTLVTPSDRATLDGIVLRIGIIPSAPFSILDTSIDEFGHTRSKIIGYIPDLIEKLQEKLRFIANITFTPPNTTYRKFLEAVANGQYDILIGDVTETAERRKLVSFSAAIFDNALRVIVRTPVSAEVDLFSYLRPFSEKLWLIIFAATAYASVLVGLLERQENPALRNRSIWSMSMMSIWYCIGTIMGYGVDFHAVTASGRLLTAGLYMLSLVLIASYTANLASKLSSARPNYIVTGVDDIKNGKLPYERVGVLQGTAIEEYFLREISRGSRQFFPLKSRKDLLENLLGGRIDASFLDSGISEYITNHIYCNLTVVGESFNHGTFGIVTQKTWPHQQDLDMSILALRESGYLNSLRKKWFQTKTCDAPPGIPTAMQLESLAGLFLTFSIITVIAVAQYLWSKRSIICKCCIKLRTLTIFHSAEIDLNKKTTSESNM